MEVGFIDIRLINMELEKRREKSVFEIGFFDKFGKFFLFFIKDSLRIVCCVFVDVSVVEM